MKVRINKDRALNIAIMSIPAVMVVPISIPFAVLAAIGFGSLLSIGSDDSYEIELSFSQWQQIVASQHASIEDQKRLETLYWRKQYEDKQS